MVISPAVNSLPTGVNYDQISAGGCNCHAAAPNAAVMVTLDGLPEEYNMSETYQVTICLLYTSPSPRDLSTSRMPSSA